MHMYIHRVYCNKCNKLNIYIYIEVVYVCSVYNCISFDASMLRSIHVPFTFRFISSIC